MNTFRLIITLLLSCLCFKATAQLTQNHDGQIVIGTVDSLYSQVLQEQRAVWVHVPEAFDSTKQYPVIYLLDAPEHFYAVTGMLKRLSPIQMPESIVVGILNTDRTRDFTPTNVSFSRGHKTETSGGANNFIKFLNQELKPFINSKYPTESNATIIGHSTGGLFVLYVYLHHEASFDNYLAIDPSLWWDKENLVEKAQRLLDKGSRKEKSLYLAVANSLGPKMDTTKIRRSKSEPSEQIRANLKFHDVLVKNTQHLNFKWEYFKDEDHGNVTIPAQYNGLRSIFSWFPFPELWRFNTPKRYSAKELTEPFYTHYEKLSIRMKRDVKPEWALINDVGFFMLEGHNLPKKALAYLEMNIHFYPDNSKTYVALGKYYTLQKDKTAAIKNYEKAFELDGNQEAQARLEELTDK